MSPEDAKILSISTDTHEGAVIVRATGELDYDYAPVFRRELTRVWNAGAGASPAQPPPAPSREPSPTFPGASPLLPESPFSPVTSSMGGGSFSTTVASTEGSFSGGGSFPVDDPLSPHPVAGPSLLSARSAFPSEPATGAVAGTTAGTTAGTGKASGAAPSWLILDLTGLTFCDSTGLAELLWSLRQSQETGTRLVVAGANRTLRHMLATTGLLAFFTMADSVEEALREAEAGTPGER